MDLFNKNKKLAEDLGKELSVLKAKVAEVGDDVHTLKLHMDDLKDIYAEELMDMHALEETILRENTIPTDIDHSASVLKNGLNLLIERDKSTRENNKNEQERWQKSIDETDKLFLGRDSVSEALEKSKGPLNAVNNNASECSALIKEMSVLSQNMGVAALNSAIEAGHLGEMGTKYVETAEKMRFMAEEYKTKADQTDKKLAEMMEQFERTSDALIHMKEIQKNEDAVIKKIRDILAANLEECKRFSGMEDMLSADGLKAELETLENHLNQDREQRNKILDKLQFLVSEAEKGSSGWNEAEVQFEKIKNQVKEIK